MLIKIISISSTINAFYHFKILQLGTSDLKKVSFKLSTYNTLMIIWVKLAYYDELIISLMDLAIYNCNSIYTIWDRASSAMI